MSTEENGQSFTTTTSCPLCNSDLIINWRGDDIPFFGEIMHIASRCGGCGFRVTDTLILAQREPVRYELKLEDPEDLNIRVVRSTSGTIRIPELGIDVEPGSVSESFVSNVEGVLDRILDVVVTACKWHAEDPAKYAVGLEVQQALRDAIDGKRELTLIVEDPMGNSAIISDKANKRHLTPEEASHLKTGMVVFEHASPVTEEDGL